MALACVSLYHFVKRLWPVIEKKPFVDGFHIEMICEHLEAVSYNKVSRLLINIPPRFSKSSIVSVMWPMWDWLRRPDRQFLRSSYNANLSMRDNLKSRRIFQSEIYQELLGEYQPDLVLVGDQNTKIRFENNETGYSLSTSVDGALTGEGGDIIIVDDPHNVREGESEAARQGCLDWWQESMSTRLNDQKTGAYVIVMQRVHEEDLSGWVLANEDGWDHICLPMEYEGKNQVVSSIGAADPRTGENDLLCSNRLGRENLEDLKSRLGSYAVAGQLQQRPTPRGGGMFPVSELRIIPVLNRNFIIKTIRYWDKAGTEGGEGARTAGVLMHIMKNGTIVVEDAVKGRWSSGKREKRIKQVAQFDAKQYGADKIHIWLEQEPGSGGKESAENTVKNLMGYIVKVERVTGDKVTRAEPFAAQVEAGNVCLLQGDWVKDYVDELESFPKGKLKDQVDASSGAFNKLNAIGFKRAGAWGKAARARSLLSDRAKPSAMSTTGIPNRKVKSKRRMGARAI